MRMVLKVSSNHGEHFFRVGVHILCYVCIGVNLSDSNLPIPLSMFQFPGSHWSHRRPITFGKARDTGRHASYTQSLPKSSVHFLGDDNHTLKNEDVFLYVFHQYTVLQLNN